MTILWTPATVLHFKIVILTSYFHSFCLSSTHISITHPSISTHKIISPLSLHHYSIPTFYFPILIASQLLGDTYINKFGRQFSVLHKTGKIKWRGPHFPTFHGRKSATAPDKIFTNSKAYFNIFSAPGPPTPSDHTIMLVKISAAPKQVPIPERRSPRKINWNSYKQNKFI